MNATVHQPEHLFDHHGRSGVRRDGEDVKRPVDVSVRERQEEQLDHERARRDPYTP